MLRHQTWQVLRFYGKVTGKKVTELARVSGWGEGMTSSLRFLLRCDATLQKHACMSWMKEKFARLHLVDRRPSLFEEEQLTIQQMAKGPSQSFNHE